MAHLDTQEKAILAAENAEEGSEQRKKAAALGSDRDPLVAGAEVATGMSTGTSPAA